METAFWLSKEFKFHTMDIFGADVRRVQFVVNEGEFAELPKYVK